MMTTNPTPIDDDSLKVDRNTSDINTSFDENGKGIGHPFEPSPAETLKDGKPRA